MTTQAPSNELLESLRHYADHDESAPTWLVRAAADEIERLRSAHEPPLEQRPLSASQRLHNICDALSEQADESPFTKEEWERVDKEAVAAQARIRELEAEVSTLRDHLAEQNRLLSLNCREVERLQKVLADGPGAEDGPWAEGWRERTGQPPVVAPEWVYVSDGLPETNLIDCLVWIPTQNGGGYLACATYWPAFGSWKISPSMEPPTLPIERWMRVESPVALADENKCLVCDGIGFQMQSQGRGRRAKRVPCPACSTATKGSDHA